MIRPGARRLPRQGPATVAQPIVASKCRVSMGADSDLSGSTRRGDSSFEIGSEIGQVFQAHGDADHAVAERPYERGRLSEADCDRAQPERVDEGADRLFAAAEPEREETAIAIPDHARRHGMA